MGNNKSSGRESKARLARMQANNALHDKQLRRRKRDNIIAIIAMAAAVVIAIVLALTAFQPKDDKAAQDAPETAATQSADPAQSNSPGVPEASTAEGKTFTGTLSLNGKPLSVTVDGSKAPQAAAVFKSLADSDFMNGKSCHRLTDAPNFGVLQCGSLNGDGQGDPDYQWGPVENTPSDGQYPAGTIAVARANSTYSNGTQFFITYKDTILPQETGGYTIVGQVTSGLDAVLAIANDGIKGNGTDDAPKTKVTIDSFKLK